MKPQPHNLTLIARTLSRVQRAKHKHRRSKACEFPRTCGACHYFSGYIQCLQELPANSASDSATERETTHRLTAAAPALLQACKRILRAIEWARTEDRLSSSERSDILRAAIAKAEGH